MTNIDLNMVLEYVGSFPESGSSCHPSISAPLEGLAGLCQDLGTCSGSYWMMLGCCMALKNSHFCSNLLIGIVAYALSEVLLAAVQLDQREFHGHHIHAALQTFHNYDPIPRISSLKS